MDCWFSIKTVHSPNPAMCARKTVHALVLFFQRKQIDLCPAAAILSQEIEKAVSMHG